MLGLISSLGILAEAKPPCSNFRLVNIIDTTPPYLHHLPATITMALAQPVLPFLRPLGLPRPSTLQRFLRFSTSSSSRAES